MDLYDSVLSKYDAKSLFLPIVRTILQRIMPATKLDKLFNDTADRQYQQTLLFSTVVELMFGATVHAHNVQCKTQSAQSRDARPCVCTMDIELKICENL